MSDEGVPLVNDEEISVEGDLSSEVVPIVSPPPDYESSLQPITSPVPPYPGADIELPDYCDVVVTSPTTNQPIIDDPDGDSQSINEQGFMREWLSYVLLIGCAVVAVVLFAPLGVVALLLSVVAAKKWHFYKEQSLQRKTAIGCILLAFVVGIPAHVIIWRHFTTQ